MKSPNLRFKVKDRVRIAEGSGYMAQTEATLLNGSKIFVAGTVIHVWGGTKGEEEVKDQYGTIAGSTKDWPYIVEWDRPGDVWSPVPRSSNTYRDQDLCFEYPRNPSLSNLLVETSLSQLREAMEEI